MPVAPMPNAERDRLTGLSSLDLMDSQPEDRFDRIVTLAADVLGVPIAFVALVDQDRHLLKAKVGLAVCQTPKYIAFISHTMRKHEPLIVEDALADPRFADNPLVTGEPFFRFYAGHPLTTETNQVVGTFCIADRVPRRLWQNELRVFRALAKMIEREIRLVDLVHLQHALLATNDKLQAAQTRIKQELAEAAAYVRSLLPDRLTGAVRTDWAFWPSSALGGDLFGYHWMDPDHLAIYLLDVMGHGVGAALLSASVHAALRNGELRGVQMRKPDQVLTGLNRAFPMDRNGGRFFTIWYGVYERASRALVYASAGHPPPMIFEGQRPVVELAPTGMVIGLDEAAEYTAAQHTIPLGARLYLYTDGILEIAPDRNQVMAPADLATVIGQTRYVRGAGAEVIVAEVRARFAVEEFVDDVSLLEFTFD